MKARIVMILMAVALIALPTMAQQQEWKSTSTMQGTGSSYSSQVNAVGATVVSEMATTTASYSPAKAPGGPRKIEAIGGGDGGNGSGLVNPGDGDPGSPIGDAVLPLILCAAVFCGVIALRRKRSALSR